MVVSATNELGVASGTSGPSALFAPAAPAKRGTPKVSGAGQDGQLMSAGAGTWKGTPPFSYSYRWEACNSLGAACSITPQRRPTYTLGGVAGSASVPSAATGLVAGLGL